MTDQINLNGDAQNAFESLNKLRENPTSFSENFNILSKALGRIPLQKTVSEELQSFTTKLNTFTNLPQLKLSPGLCSVAEDFLLMVHENGPTSFHYMDFEDYILQCRKHVGGFNKIIKIMDHGSLDQLFGRIVIHQDDPKRTYRDALFDNDMKYVGVASELVDEEPTFVFVIADEIIEGESKHVYNPNDYPELKQAFDLFDVSNIGRIQCKEIKKTMLDLGFHHKAPIVFNIINQLDNPNNLIGADFNDYMETILSNVNDKSEEGLKNIFSLYKDDASADTISLRNLKKMAFDLDEKDLLAEINGLIKLARTDGVTLTYEEFSQFYFNEEE